MPRSEESKRKQRINSKTWYDKNKSIVSERYKEYRKNWYIQNKEKVKERSRKNWYKDTYGLNIEEVNKLKSLGCQVCGLKDKFGTGGLCIDHDHITGEVRGCLCHSCNTALGHLRESPALAMELYNYMVNSCGRRTEKTRNN